MTENTTLQVQVALALPNRQAVIDVEVIEGCTADEAVEKSGIATRFPEEDLSGAKLGIFGKAVRGSQVLKQGDRVEVYRPLIADPKDSRRKRADRAKSKRDEKEE